MKCNNCNRTINNPQTNCPHCGAVITEDEHEQFRREQAETRKREAAVRDKWRKIEITAMLIGLIGLVIVPLTIFTLIRHGLVDYLWVAIVLAVLWVGGFIFFGFIKGGFRCPFCGGFLGNNAGDYCQHCSKRFRG